MFLFCVRLERIIKLTNFFSMYLKDKQLALLVIAYTTVLFKTVVYSFF